MKIINRLANWLYRKYGDVDVSEMTRLQLIGHVERVRFRDMTDAKKKEVKGGCIDLLEGNMLKFVVDEYVSDIKDHILYEANSETQMLLGRFSLNGASAIFERAEAYAKWEPPVEDPFNKHDVI